MQDLLQLYNLQQLHNLLQSQKDESGLTFTDRYLSYVLLLRRAAKETVFTTHIG